MKRQLGSALAAIVAVAALAAVSRVSADDQDKSVSARQGDDQNAPDRVSQGKRITLPPGAKPRDEPNKEDRGGIIKTLDGLIEASLTNDGFDDVVERFVDADRNRFGKDGATERKYDDLNALAQSLRTIWRTKYGKDFEIDPEKSLTHVATLVGEIEDPQAFAVHWPVPPVVPDVAEAVPAAAKDEPAPANDPDTNLERGRDVAIATFQESEAEDLPALHVSLIQEAAGWRVDVPDAMTAQQLHDSLVRHLTHLRDNADKWPVEDAPAGLMFSRHVAMAVYGLELPKTASKKEKRTSR